LPGGNDVADATGKGDAATEGMLDGNPGCTGGNMSAATDNGVAGGSVTAASNQCQTAHPAKASNKLASPPSKTRRTVGVALAAALPNPTAMVPPVN
jgi:hypothetical protein